jgi:hypothetical protein
MPVDGVGSLPSVVYRIVAPVSWQSMVTDCGPSYRPGGGLKAGAGTTPEEIVVKYQIFSDTSLFPLLSIITFVRSTLYSIRLFRDDDGVKTTVLLSGKENIPSIGIYRSSATTKEDDETVALSMSVLKMALIGVDVDTSIAPSAGSIEKTYGMASQYILERGEFLLDISWLLQLTDVASVMIIKNDKICFIIIIYPCDRINIIALVTGYHLW